MVVTERKVRLVLKALLVRRVPRVSKELLALVENVVVMVMTEQPVQLVHVERQVLKVSQVKMAKQASVVNAGCLVTMGRVVVMVAKGAPGAPGADGKAGRDGATGAVGRPGRDG